MKRYYFVEGAKNLRDVRFTNQRAALKYWREHGGSLYRDTHTVLTEQGAERYYPGHGWLQA